jgi:hypothetical protein
MRQYSGEEAKRNQLQEITLSCRKAQKYQPKRVACSLYSSRQAMVQAFCCGRSLSVSGLIPRPLGHMGYVKVKVKFWAYSKAIRSYGICKGKGKVLPLQA